jgi:hypothetical protein
MANDYSRPARLRVMLLLILGGCTAIGCTPQRRSDVPTDERRYDCDNGLSFTAAFSEGRVRIDTKGYSYDLEERTTSVGVRYGAKNVAFAQDQDRAVLIGAADGPYKGCTESGFRIEK